jgi:glycosyltransferase involved in cell wall biosynthesis
MANLIEGLKTMDDVELHIVTFNGQVQDTLRVQRDRLNFYYVPSSSRLHVLTLHREHRRRSREILREIQPDIVHAQDALTYGYTCLKSARSYPLVVSVHGIVREERKHLSRARDRLRARLTSWLIERYCLKNARYLIQPTRYPQQYFGPLITGKIFDTGNAISEKFFQVASESEPCRLLYSGLVLRRKRLLDLLQALAILRQRFPRITLRVAGATPEPQYLDLVKASIANQGLQQHVELLGPLSQEELLEEYRKCTLLVLPSGQETSPMVIGEVMAMGKPVVATRVGGVPYLIDEGQTGYIVDVGDVEAIVSRITSILSDEELQTRMSHQSREKACHQFRSRVVAERVYEVYQQAIASAV